MQRFLPEGFTFLDFGDDFFPTPKNAVVGMVYDNMTLVLSHRSGSGGHRCSQFIMLYIHLHTHMYIYIYVCISIIFYMHVLQGSREGIGM